MDTSKTINKRINEELAKLEETSNSVDFLNYEETIDEEIEEIEEIEQLPIIEKKRRPRAKKKLFTEKDYYEHSMFVIKDFKENEESKFKGADYVRTLADMSKVFLNKNEEGTDTYKMDI